MVRQVDYYLTRIDTSNLYSELTAKIHGFLMAHLDSDVATAIHDAPVDPFSMFCLEQEDYYILRVTTFNDLGENVHKLLYALKHISIFAGEIINIDILHREEVFKETLFKLQAMEPLKTCHMHIATPASFNMYGMRYPLFTVKSMISTVAKRLRLIFGINMLEEQVERLLTLIEIKDFELNRSFFVSDGEKIPGFTGRVSLSINKEAKEDDVELISFIFRMVSLFGIGMKTAMGMGGVFLAQK